MESVCERDNVFRRSYLLNISRGEKLRTGTENCEGKTKKKNKKKREKKRGEEEEERGGRRGRKKGIGRGGGGRGEEGKASTLRRK